MLRWGELNPRTFERAVQGLLYAQNPGMVPIDGSGGDGGADGMLRTADGRTVYEVKSYALRLTKAYRRKVAGSLGEAVKTVPDMSTWVLVVPINPTRGELTWFENELQLIAPGVALEWRGVGWLDLQAAEHLAFARMVQGPYAQVLAAAAEVHLEQAVMTGGVEDLFTRNKRLRERIDDVSLHWTVDWAIEGAVTTTTLRPKHPDAPRVDPIHLTPRFTFDPKNDEALKVQAKLEATMNYGGAVELNSEYFGGFDVEASAEAKLLMGPMDEPGALEIRSQVVTLPKPIRVNIRVIGDVDAELDVWCRTGTTGLRGFRINGEDSAGAVKVDLEVPGPDTPPGDATGTFNISFENPWQFAPKDLVPVLRLHTAMRAGGQVNLKIPGFVMAMTTVPGQLDGPNYGDLLRIAEVVTKLEEHLDLTLRLPDGATLHQVRTAEAAVAALEGHQVDSTFSSITAKVIPGHVKNFVSQLPDGEFAVHTVHSSYTLTLGDLEIEYGPLALWMPQVRLSNRASLLRRPNAKSPKATFTATGQPIYIRTREDTLTFLEDRESDADAVEVAGADAS